MRLGVFGGTFDPLHIGHLVAAQNAQYAASLDHVLFVVANIPWQKEYDRDVTDPLLRLAVVSAVVDQIPGFAASDLEIRRGGRSYTVDTLRSLREAHPYDELYLIVGSDAAAQMSTWERADELPSLCRLVVVNRYGYPSPSVMPGFAAPIFAEMPWLDISSSDLRARVRDRRPLQFLLPDEAIRVIDRYGLYRDETSPTATPRE